MKKLYTILSILLFSNGVFAQEPTLNWAGILHSDSVSTIGDVKTDSNGNMFICGSYTTNIDFDFGTGTFNLPANGSDAFLAKYNNQHMRIWSYKFGSSGDDQMDQLLLSNDGFLYVYGLFSGTVNFDPNSSFTLTSLGAKDAFIAKYDLNGGLIWAKQFGGASGNVFIRNMCFDENQNLLVCAFVIGTADMDPGAGTMNVSSALYDPVFLKLSPSGNFMWGKHLVGTNMGQISDLKVHTDGSIYLTGWARGTLDVDPGAGTTNFVAGDTTHGFVVKYNSTGDFQWVKFPQSTDEISITGISILSSGDLLLSGTFKSTTDFDPNVGTHMLTSTGTKDLFLLKLSASGNYIWSKRIGGQYDEYLSKVLVDNQDEIYLVGYFLDTIDLDPDGSHFQLISNNSLDMFYMKLDALGGFIWAKSAGGSGVDVIRTAYLDQQNKLYLVGQISSLVDVDPSPGFSNLVSTGYRNGVLIVLNQGNVGLVENSESNVFIVSPNPTDGHFKITFSTMNKYTEVQLLNSMGQVLRTEIISPNTSSTELLAKELNNGLYFIRVKNEYGSCSEAQKIIIKK